jgi:hypothetical protein
LTGPDLTKGVAEDALFDGAALAGHAFGEPGLLTRVGDEFFAVGGTCTHYSAPLVWRSRQVVPTIAALRAYAAEIRDAEVAHALARLGDLSPREALVVRALAQRIVGRLLHRPMTALRADAEGANMARVLRQLFQLEPEAEQPGRRLEARTASRTAVYPLAEATPLVADTASRTI